MTERMQQHEDAFDITLWEDRVVYTPTIGHAYVILGFLCEYMGRRIVEDSDLIENFCLNETATADKFEMHLTRLCEDRQLTISFRAKSGDSKTRAMRLTSPRFSLTGSRLDGESAAPAPR